MRIKDVFKKGVLIVAAASKSPVFEGDDGCNFAFPTPFNGLCLLGIGQIGAKLDYMDIRCKLLMGEATSSLNLYDALRSNEAFPESSFGLAVIEGRNIFTMNSDYRFLLSWAADEIQDVMRLRFIFPVSMVPAGVRPLPSSFFSGLVDRYDLVDLLGLKGRTGVSEYSSSEI